MTGSIDRQEKGPLDGSKAMAAEARVFACYNWRLDKRGPTENLQCGLGRRLAKNGLAARWSGRLRGCVDSDAQKNYPERIVLAPTSGD